MGKPWKRERVVAPFERGRRLRGLEEFEAPEFVGRMGRVERRRKLAWYAMLVGAIGVGTAVGLVLF